MNQDRVEDAITGYKEALTVARRSSDQLGKFYPQLQLGKALQLVGRSEEALARFEAALRIASTVGSPALEALIYYNLGFYFHQQGSQGLAVSNLLRAIAMGEKWASSIVASACGLLALIRAQEGDLAEARVLLDRAETSIREGETYYVVEFLCRRARIEQLDGNSSGARVTLNEAESIAVQIAIHPDSEVGLDLARARDLLEENPG